MSLAGRPARLRVARPALFLLLLLLLGFAAACAKPERVDLAGTDLSVERQVGWGPLSPEQEAANRDRIGFGSAELRARLRRFEARSTMLVFGRVTGARTIPVVRIISTRVGRLPSGWLERTYRDPPTELAREIPGLRRLGGLVLSDRFGPGGVREDLAYPTSYDDTREEVVARRWVVLRGDRLFLFAIVMRSNQVEQHWRDAEAMLDTVRFTPTVVPLPAPENERTRNEVFAFAHTRRP